MTSQAGTTDANTVELANGANVPSVRSFQFDSIALGKIKDSINLFRGDVNLPLNLISLAGRNGLDVNVSIIYESNVQNSINTWNLESPTGLVGLGWSLGFDRIVSIPNGTGSLHDNQFYLIAGGSTNLLVRNGNTTDGAYTYETQNYQFWRILYYPNDERWVITHENGITSIYGDKNSDRNTVQWGIKWGNWIGSSALTSGQQQFAVAWNISETQDTWGNAVIFNYESDSYSVGNGGLNYTRGSYLTKITDEFGRTIVFTYGDKYGPNYPGPNGAVEYQPPHEEPGPNPYQDQYQTKYLDTIAVNNQAGEFLFGIKFTYQLNNLSDTAMSVDIYRYLWKRYLTSITYINDKNQSLPGIKFEYYDRFAPHPGALKTITYPEGGKATYSYQKIPLVNSVKNLRINSPLSGSVPRVWHGFGYTVVTWYASNSSRLQLSVYSWAGRWIQSQIFSFNNVKFDLDTLTVFTKQDWFALVFQNTTPLREEIYLFRQDSIQFGEWSYRLQTIPLTSTLAKTVLTTGDEFLIAYNPNFSDRQFYGYNWNWKQKAWTNLVLPSVAGARPAQVSIAAKGNFYIVCSYNRSAKTGTFQLLYRDQAGFWQSGFTWTNSFDVYQPPQTPEGFAFYWSLGDTYAVATYARNIAQNPATLTSEIRVFQWNENFNILNSNSPLVKSYTSPFSGDRPLLPVLASIVENSMIGNSQHLLRYAGGNSNNPASWVGKDFDTSDSRADYQFGYGNDVAIMSKRSGNITINQFLQFNPSQNRWSDPLPLSTTGHYPRGNGNYFNIDNAVYARTPSGEWRQLSQALPGNLNPKSVQNLAPAYIAYEDTTGRNTQVVPLKNGQLQTANLTNLTNEKIYIDQDALKPGTSLASANTLVTYPATQTFDQAGYITLYRLAEGTLTGTVADFQVNYIQIDDGLTSGTPYSQFYLYDQSTVVYDSTTGLAQYSKVTVLPGCSQDTPNPPYGRTDYYYSNGISRQAGAFYPVGTIYNYARILNGILLCKREYDADRNEVSSTVNFWKILVTRTQLGSSQFVNLYGAYTRLEKTVTVLDSVTQTTENSYDLSTGLITQTKTYNYDSKGQQEVITQSSLYAWQVDDYRQAMVAKNLWTAIVQTISKLNDIVTLSYVTTWKNWATNGDWKWAPYQNYRLQQGTSTPTFNFSNPDLNLWLKLSEINSVTAKLGHIQEQTDVLGLRESGLYDREQTYLVATFSNASLASEQISYCGFEAYEDSQGWQIYPNSQPLQNCSASAGRGIPYISSEDAHTGQNCLKLPPNSGSQVGVQRTFHLTPEHMQESYILSCWVKTESDFGSDNGTAAWTISFAQNGQTTGNPISVAILDTSSRWLYLHQIIDLTQQNLNKSAPLEITLSVYNQKQTKVVLVDDLRFSPLLCNFAATVYRSRDWLVTATLGNNGETIRQVYDDFSRQIATIGPAENVASVATEYFSRSGHNDTFNPDLPNSRLAIRARAGGIYDDFQDGQWQDLWRSDHPSDWTVRNSALVYSGNQLGQIRLKGSDVYSNYGVMVKVIPPDTMAQTVSLSIGQQVIVQWSPVASQWQLLINGNANPVSTVTQPTLKAAEWLLVVMEKGVLFYAGGRQIFSYLLPQTITGPLTISAGDAVKFQDVVVFREPQISIAYQDGSGKTRQSQVLEGNNTIVTESVYDEIGRLAIETKPARYINTLFRYQPDFVTGVAWSTTGVMTGYVADYYAADGEGHSDDQGYPYSRTRFESSPRSRKVETGAPGKDFAITNLDTTRPQDRHTIKYQYGANQSDSLPALRNLPQSQYFVSTVTNQDGTVSVNVKDQVGNSVADGLEIDPANLTYITSASDYTYSSTGKVVTQQLPNYFNPPESSQTDQWVITSTYDILEHLIQRTTPDTTHPARYIYDRAGKLRFMQDAEAADQGYVLYTKYDSLGRITEGGLFHQAWDQNTLQNLANNEPAQPTANNIWLRRYFYDGDGTDTNAIGRLTKVLVSKGDAESSVAVTEALTYDIFGRVISKQLLVSDYSDRTYDIRYTYDNLGNILSVDYGSHNSSPGPVVYYTYNQLNQVVGVGNAPDNPNYYATYAYYANGALQQESLNNSSDRPIVRSFIYNSPGWLQQIDNDVFRETISYTAGGYSLGGSSTGYYSGKIAQTTSTFGMPDPGNFAANFSYQYQYDRAGRLQIAQNLQNNQPFLPYSLGLSPQGAISYDHDGNIKHLDNGNASNAGGYAYRGYAYQGGSNQLQTVSIQTETGTSSENFTADANGNVIAVSGKLQALTYNPLTQMTASITPTADVSHPVTFTYGGGSQRVLKQQADTQKLYLHGGNDYPLIELEKTGAGAESTTFYIYGPNGLIAFAPAATSPVPTWLYVLKDRQSSTRAVVHGSTRQVVAAYNYLPFGEFMGSVYGSSVIAYLYTGQEYDVETGLYNYRARFYDSRLGRFYGPDPAGQQPSPFAYAGNDPILFSDKTGRIFGIDDLLVGLAISALIGLVVGAVSGGIGYAVTHTDDFNVNDFFKNVGIGALTGAVSGAIGFGVGSAATSGLTALGASAGQSIVGGVAGGIVSGAGSGAAASVSGQLLDNAINGKPLGAGLGDAALTGAIVGAITGGIGGAFGAVAARSGATSAGPAARSRFAQWLNFRGDIGGQTDLTSLRPGPWTRYNTAITNNDAPGTWGYVDTAAHEGFHAFLARHAGFIWNAGDAGLLGIPIGAPVKYVEEIFAYSIGHGAALRIHAIPLAPLEAFGSLSWGESKVVLGLYGIGSGVGSGVGVTGSDYFQRGKTA